MQFFSIIYVFNYTLVKCPTFILVGEKEPPILINRAKEASKIISGAKFILVREAKHNIDNKNYINSIKELLISIN